MEKNSAYDHLARGIVLMQQRKYYEAAEAFEYACDAKPDLPEAWRMLGLTNLQRGNFPGAVTALRQFNTLVPDNIESYIHLGIALQHQEHLNEARECYQHALDLSPDNVMAIFHLATLERKQGRITEAVQGYRLAIQLKPDYVEAYNNLGNILQSQQLLAEAADCFKRAIAINQNIPALHYNLANALTYQGKLTEAISSFRRSLELDPYNAVVRSNMLLILNYIPDQDTETLYREHLRWDEIHGIRVPLPNEYSNAPDPDRILKVGYVSPDFRTHPVGHLIAPALKFHNGTKVQSYCYSDVSRPDSMTQELRQRCTVWRNTGGMNDVDVAKLIRQDNIDILVDLAGHTSRGRLGVFVRKPSPIQVTYMGYPNSTGLRAIDYWLTDKVADPPELDGGSYHSEELVYLNTGFTCFEPSYDAPDVGPLPLRRNGYITFGSLNNLSKLNDQVIALWSSVLNSVPIARLLICRDLLTPEIKKDIRGRFLQHGIEQDQLELVSEVAIGRGHLNIYNEIDVALDPFPWTGHFTTCEALWMGVPVITLHGCRHAGRMVASVLRQVGLDRLIARTPQEYVEIASSIADNPKYLEQLRTNLRENIRRSPLCDGARFAEALEGAYREMWRHWCNCTTVVNKF